MEGMCPETHFWCLDKDYCLPVFLRCNGVYDCPGHEDEDGCDVYTCPGFYRCRASKVCVHVTHVCDGWPLCPQDDDELLCAQQCPLQCTCQGLAFFCRQTFEPHQFLDLRYLDAGGSGLKVQQLGKNQMLIHLSLARCGVASVSNFTFPNLVTLDLSDNMLTKVSAQHFSQMPQLTVLFLAGNPLAFVFRMLSDSDSELRKIKILDLSRVETHSMGPSLFIMFPNLQSLNLSYSHIELLQWNSSQMSVSSVQKLDLRGCLITDVPQLALRGFLRLQLLLSDSYKLCCPSVLPPGFDLNHCHVTPDEVSSCDYLFGVSTYRIAVAVLATLALVGNAASLTWRVCVRKTWKVSHGGVVLTHLSAADLGMGLYLTILVLADRLMAGRYMWRDVAWRRGAVCQLAGVLATSCRQAAVFFTAILILIRCSHQSSTFTARLTPFKVKVMCMVVWVSSVVLASVPLTAQWRIFGQQAVCVPLPHRRSDSLESHYTSAVMLFVPFVVFILCSLCEVVRCLSGRVTKISCMSTDAWSNDFHFVVWGSLTCGFLHVTACLVPTHSATDGQTAVHTALVYLAFVVNCAANPYLHLYGVRVEVSKRKQEERLLKIVNRTRF